ncbi:AraC family transcriptional regulator [Subtercola boreus]|uniref:AraC family transcriptional regulator n=1 Tax=Subtercola boreus TaxID=120213 RepID=UPI0015592B64|nr:AraC family transcriptional regulator [Subtercola boreus]
MLIEEGFPGQRLRVLPVPQIRAALASPATSHLLVTDAGFFPRARSHGMTRRTGIPQAIVIVCTQGTGWCSIAGTTHRVGPGQALVIPPGTAHAYGADPDDPWTLWWMHLAGDDLVDLLGVTTLTASSPVRELTDPFRISELVDESVRALEHDQTDASLLAAAGAAWHLLSLLASERSPQSPRLSAIDRAREHLRKNFAEDVSIADLAAVARLSPSHFAALFRQQTGTTPLRYQVQLRMARARELLDTTDLAVATVAGMAGYSDPFYFSRQFKALHGTTPLRYRGHAKG